MAIASASDHVECQHHAVILSLTDVQLELCADSANADSSNLLNGG